MAITHSGVTVLYPDAGPESNDFRRMTKDRAGRFGQNDVETGAPQEV